MRPVLLAFALVALPGLVAASPAILGPRAGARADSLLDVGDPRAAEQLARAALAAAAGEPAPDSLAIAVWSRRLGAALADQERLDEARPLLERALALAARLAGQSAAETAEALMAHGSLLERSRDLSGALAACDRALAIWSAGADGDSNLARVAAMAAKGRLLAAMRRLEEGERVAREALMLRERALGPDHPLVAASLDDLGWIRKDEGDYREAAALLRRELAILERVFGPSDLRTARPLSSLSVVLRYFGDHAEAEVHARRMIAILEADGSRPLGVAKGLHNLAST